MTGFDVVVLCVCSFIAGMALEAYRDKWQRQAMEPYRPKDDDED